MILGKLKIIFHAIAGDVVTFKLNVTMIARMPVFLKLFKTVFQKRPIPEQHPWTHHPTVQQCGGLDRTEI